MFRTDLRLRSIALRAGWCLLAGWLTLARAGSAPGQDVPADSQAAADGVLLMRTGTVIFGKILKSGEYYEVVNPHGSMQVPGSMVRMRCDSIQEVYKKLRASVEKQQSALAHLSLSRWCLTYELHAEAREQAQAALELEPDREDARRLVRRADELLNNPRPAARAEAESAPPRERSVSPPADEPISLGGLSRDLARDFSRRIQPLLMNSCMASGCHGPDSKTGFHLQKVVSGSNTSRHAAERNLVEVLEQIDFKKPRSSPLLVVPRGNHGRRNRPVFSGTRGPEQLAELQRWVMAVSREESAREKTSAPIAARPANNPLTPRGVDVPVAARPFDKLLRSVPSPRADESPEPNAQTGDRPLPDRGAADPFDPAVFNRGADLPSGGR